MASIPPLSKPEMTCRVQNRVVLLFIVLTVSSAGLAGVKSVRLPTTSVVGYEKQKKQTRNRFSGLKHHDGLAASTAVRDDKPLKRFFTVGFYCGLSHG